MEASYIMDMQINYLILESKNNNSNGYIAKMILNNGIIGLLNVELRSIDDRDYFYYDITSKDSLSNIYKNQLLGYSKLKSILIKVIDTLERSSEYLLNEERFVLNPDYIYLDQDDFTPLLCYFVDYNESLLVQFGRLIEYFMNKVDYKDEKAVLLVYALYKITKESNITLEQLKDELYKDMNNPTSSDNYNEKDSALLNSDVETNPYEQNYSYEQDNKANDYDKERRTTNKRSKINSLDNNHYMDEIRDEEEVLSYSKKSYIITAISITVIMVIFIIMFQFKLLYNTFGTQIDLIKLLCFIIVIACAEGLLLSKLFHTDKKIVKLVPIVKNVSISNSQSANYNKEPYQSSNYYQEPELYKEDNYDTQMLWNVSEDEEDNKTEILVTLDSEQTNFYIESFTSEKEKVFINSSPFIIGKNSSGVNYRIEDASVSRFHARFSISDESISVTDLGSLNGTYVNGIKLKEHTTYDLSVNDELFFSKCKFIVKKS